MQQNYFTFGYENIGRRLACAKDSFSQYFDMEERTTATILY
jgi:hypothetical protein